MTQAVFTYELGHLKTFTVSGHSGYQTSGSDIVCSSITTAVFTIINLFDKFEFTHDYLLQQNEQEGFIKVDITKSNPTIDLLGSGLIDVLVNIAEQYPKYLQIKVN